MVTINYTGHRGDAVALPVSVKYIVERGLGCWVAFTK